MKIRYYYLDGCPHCKNMDTKLKHIKFGLPLSKIERSNISLHDKREYDIKLFPTIIFIKDDGTLINKIEGDQSEKEILSVFKTSQLIDERK